MKGRQVKSRMKHHYESKLPILIRRSFRSSVPNEPRKKSVSMMPLIRFYALHLVFLCEQLNPQTFNQKRKLEIS